MPTTRRGTGSTSLDISRGLHATARVHRRSGRCCDGAVCGACAAAAHADGRISAQHVAFANPSYLTRDEVPAEAIEKERATVEAITREEGKPEAALPKIVEGRVNAFIKGIALLDQDYAKDNKISVAKAAENAGITIQGFARVKVGA